MVKTMGCVTGLNASGGLNDFSGRDAPGGLTDREGPLWDND
jgi:hypothetical protein